MVKETAASMRPILSTSQVPDESMRQYAEQQAQQHGGDLFPGLCSLSEQWLQQTVLDLLPEARAQVGPGSGSPSPLPGKGKWQAFFLLRIIFYSKKIPHPTPPPPGKKKQHFSPLFVFHVSGWK